MNLFSALFGGGENTLSATDAQARIAGENAPIILDVRENDEFRGGHISGAKHIPLGELSKRMKELPKDRDIICVCRSGGRSASAMSALNGAGYKAFNLRGGMMSWQSAGLPIKKGK